MRVAVVHTSLNFCGGAEKVCLTILDSLKRHGYHTSIVTVDRVDWQRIREIFGSYVKPDEEITLIDKPYVREASVNLIQASSIGLKFLGFIRRVLKGFDLTVNTYGDLDILNLYADLAYSGLPFSASTVYPETAPYLLRGRVSRSLYSLAVSFMAPIIAHRHPTILANSTFTRKALERIYSSKAKVKVLHPPCNVERYSEISDSRMKENIVITISRFSPGKNLELLPSIVNRTEGWKFKLIGSATQASQSILALLRKKIRQFNIEDRLELIVNAPKSTLEELLLEAKIYLHLMKNEPFGISVVEAMAAGCVPVTHASGGVWHDVLEGRQGYYGYGYESYGEIPRYIKTLEDDRLYVEISKRAVKKAKMFSVACFQERFIKEFKYLIHSKLMTA